MGSDISTPDLIVHDGYQVETHTVLTPDGYILSIHRILSTSTNTTSGKYKIAILSHGLLGSSIDWILLGPRKALPYLLSDAGYDVWLPNFRGNKYSRSHMTKVADSAEFWNFSWHEIGLFDIPAVIDYVRETTGESPQIHFFAYCMSGSALLALLSSSQRYNAILKSATLLAPLVYMDHIKGPLQNLAELYAQYKNNINTFMTIESEFKIEELFNSLEIVCKDNEPWCRNPLLLLGDNGKKNISLRTNNNNIQIGVSTKTIIHYLQIIKSGQFQMFDLGESKNYEKYGTASPPLYHLFNVKVPSILFNSINDPISTVSDISKLAFHIPGIINHLIKVDNFSHLDFLWAENATQLVYFPLIKELQQI
ncbi:lipase 3-like [Maniola hyperantus]|uniref:lipase 3-like n=1 Tax=Aphantopus hyperantus TaxID=2795564 RepID=UPI00374A93CC